MRRRRPVDEYTARPQSSRGIIMLNNGSSRNDVNSPPAAIARAAALETLERRVCLSTTIQVGAFVAAAGSTQLVDAVVLQLGRGIWNGTSTTTLASSTGNALVYFDV